MPIRANRLQIGSTPPPAARAAAEIAHVRDDESKSSQGGHDACRWDVEPELAVPVGPEGWAAIVVATGFGQLFPGDPDKRLVRLGFSVRQLFADGPGENFGFLRCGRGSLLQVGNDGAGDYESNPECARGDDPLAPVPPVSRRHHTDGNGNNDESHPPVGRRVRPDLAE